MDALITDVTTAATVIGFPILAVVVALILWFGTRIFRDISKIFNEMRYDRWYRKNAERDWSNIEASWLLEPHEYEDERPDSLSSDWYHRHDTDVLFTTLELQDQLYNFQEERNERS